MDFEQQGSTQTLAAGIAEYHSANPGLARALSSGLAHALDSVLKPQIEMTAEAQAFFRAHDAVHVVFGCGTNLDDELVVKLSSLFGTTGGFAVLRGYRLHESFRIYRRLHHRDVLHALLHSFYLVPRTVFRSLRQRGKWPWHDFERYADVPLREIRSEFGIRVARFGARR